jgi:hypothetical protein
MTDQDLVKNLSDRAEDVCRKLLPTGKKVAGKWLIGGLDGSAGKSLEVILSGPKTGVYLERASGDGGSLWKLWKETRGITYGEAADEAADFLGIPRREKENRPSVRLNPSAYEYETPVETALTRPDPVSDEMPPFRGPPPDAPKLDWDSCLMDLTEEHIEAVCGLRGYSRRFVEWLHEQEMIGIFKGCVAFPVHNDKGDVVRIHFKTKDHWQYHPKGGDTAPLLVGAPSAHAESVLVFESQWDAFAMLDKLEAHYPENATKYCAYITRGASSNTNLAKLAVPRIIACPQNDPAEKASKTSGRTPAEEWLFRIQASKHKNTSFSVFDTPAQHKDANDWIRADNPTHETVVAMFAGSKNPLLKSVMSAAALLDMAESMQDDPDSLIGYERRFLGRGGSFLMIGPSGIGKSSLMASLACHAAAGIEWHGIKFRRPLKVLVIQAENDNGDLAEMLSGVFRDNHETMNQFGKEGLRRLITNLLFNNLTDKTGPEFINHLEQMVRGLEIDLVIIDPLLSYVGDDISLQKVASNFLRHTLLPVMKSTGVMVGVVHHTGKPPKEKNGKISNSELSYSGLGSSELVNWARAVMVIVETDQDGIFEFRITKRGPRAGMTNIFTGEKTDRIHICHNQTGSGIFWKQTRYETHEEPAKERRGGGGGYRGKRINTSDYIHLIPNRITNTDLAELLRTQAGMSGGQVKAAIRELRTEGLMNDMGDGTMQKRD